MSEEQSRRLALTAEIIVAYVSENKISAKELTGLIGSVYASLAPTVNPKGENLVPAVPIKRSVFPDYIICLEDGKKLKMLKRHLQTAYGMTTEEYRIKWGLPPQYPMVAPNYTARRSALAREIGLGRHITSAATERDVIPAEEAASHTNLPTKRRGRKKSIH